MKIHLTFNKVVKILILSDLVFYAGWGLFNPVFAIFVTERIKGGNAFVAGMASAVYALTLALLRVPIGMLLDACPSEKDDYFSMVIGLFIASIVPFAFIFTKTPLGVYVLQGIHAVGMALSLSGWTAIFTRHIDKGKEATEWSLDATSVGLGSGVAAAIGGWAVTKFGFSTVLLFVGVFGLVGSVLLLALRNNIKGVFDHGLHFSFHDIFNKEKQ
ncbi:MFS transporter [bacterium]|nr:MFS transporter [bacterium]